MEPVENWKDVRILSDLKMEVSVREEQKGERQLLVIRAVPEWDGKTKGTLELQWDRPAEDIQYDWFPACRSDRSLRVNWYQAVESSLPSSAPVFCFYNESGVNRMTFAMSEVLRPVGINAGIREEDGTLLCSVQIPLEPGDGAFETTLCRIFAPCRYEEALRSVSDWWEKDCGFVPAQVPEAARQPLYSAWYSYHQQITAEGIEEECARAKAMGLDAIIVDDGWQTDDSSRGYAFCGDWEPARTKIPDMAAHVAKVHALGMKYVLWYGLPFVGYQSRHWEAFRGKLLEKMDGMKTGVLDPRYPDVRRFLIGTCVDAMHRWDLDGFKLDMIDAFRMGNCAAESSPEMDIPLLAPAVNRLMLDLLSALRAEKPEILVEFRQSYIGPAMRQYGNMFRVGDCPDDRISNRVGVVDLRLISGNTAVHSDMLMWHRDESPENAAAQIINVIFGVPQISVRLDKITPEQRKMLLFWIGFVKKNRKLLLDAPLTAEAPQLLYPLVSAEADGRAITAVYECGRVVPVDFSRCETVTVLNATPQTKLWIGFPKPQNCRVEIFDCCGEPVRTDTLPAAEITKLEIPASGLAVFSASL